MWDNIDNTSCKINKTAVILKVMSIWELYKYNNALNGGNYEKIANLFIYPIYISFGKAV